jgi:hypothetical protein
MERSHGMRNIIDFRSYLTRIAYDAKGRRFFCRTLAQDLHDADGPSRKRRAAATPRAPKANPRPEDAKS